MEYSPLVLWASLLPFFNLIIQGIFYFLFSFGLFTISRRREVPLYWLSWIPIGQFYVVGAIAKSLFNIPRMDLVLPIGAIALLFLIWVPFFGGVLLYAYLVLLLVYAILLIGSLNILYRQYAPRRAVLYTVLSCIGLAPIFVFVIRDNTPVEIERAA